jgi:hypothetical protein
VSMGLSSTGEYDIPEGLMCGVPRSARPDRSSECPGFGSTTSSI